MYLSPDVMRQIAADRQASLRAQAPPKRADSATARRRFADTLRRAADRLDAATGAPCPACALSGRG